MSLPTAVVLFFSPTPFILFLVIPGNGICIALYLVTTLLTVAEARRLRFSAYALPLVRGMPSAFFGCLILWQVCFPLFLVNRYRIVSGKANPLPSGGRAGPNVGFGCLMAVSGGSA